MPCRLQSCLGCGESVRPFSRRISKRRTRNSTFNIIQKRLPLTNVSENQLKFTSSAQNVEKMNERVKINPKVIPEKEPESPDETQSWTERDWSLVEDFVEEVLADPDFKKFSMTTQVQSVEWKKSVDHQLTLPQEEPLDLTMSKLDSEPKTPKDTRLSDFFISTILAD